MMKSEQSLYPVIKKICIKDVAVRDLEIEVLPTVLKRFVEDGAQRMQCPPDFIAVAALCSAAAVMGASVRIQPKVYDDQYLIVPTLWGALIGAPSSMKSPSMSYALKPAESLEEVMRSGHKNAELEYQTNKRIYEINLKKAEAKLNAEGEGGISEKCFADLAMALEAEPQPPCEPRLVVNDSTVPKLGELMKANPRGLFLVRDELAGWLTSIQGEAGAEARTFYLESYNGDGHFTQDRISRDKVRIENCCLSILGGLQPSKLRPIVSGAMSGKEDDGLLQRLQLSVWPSAKLGRRFVDQKPNERCRVDFEKSLASFLRYTLDEPKVVRFSCDAQTLFQIWWEKLQDEITNIESDVFQSYKIKQEKTLCSVACIFQLLQEPSSSEITAVNFKKAESFLSYLESHAKKIYKLDEYPEVYSAMLIYKRRERLSEEFTAREIQRKGWPGLNNAEKVRAALECLEDHGYLISAVKLTSSEEGGQGKKMYAWNPHLAEDDVRFDN